YLERRSRDIEIEPSSSFRLRPAKWIYHAPLLSFALGVYFFLNVPWEKTGGRVLMLGLALFTGLGGIWWFVNLLRASLTIADGKVIYREGSERREVVAADIKRVSLYWFWFQVELN